MLKETNAKVCANIVEGRFFLAKMKGNATADRNSWGINAADSRRTIEDAEADELKYNRILYGEKL